LTKEKIELIGLSKEELKSELEKIGEKSFRAKQIWHWLYHQGETDFNKMSSLSKSLREKLPNFFTITRPTIIKEENSEDRTRKWLLQYNDKEKIETVYIPEEDRGAVCISTQVGCAVGCKFCNTGRQGLTRNLSAGEIVSQFMIARDSYNEWPTPTDTTRYLSNIVVMGMGEPLHNMKETIKALKIIMDPEGIALSKRRITLSTSGVATRIPTIAKELGVKLALSLHAPNDEIRDKIMPINHKFKIKEVLDACKEYQKITGGRQYITIEYVMLDGINDAPEHAKELIKLMKDRNLGVKFNLIPFNPWKGSEFKCSSRNKIVKFSKILENAGYSAPVRVSRGQDISAACGQLKTKNKKIEAPN
jgi:23S rRNA (adenine2503-C2)-methyltransferase